MLIHFMIMQQKTSLICILNQINTSCIYSIEREKKDKTEEREKIDKREIREREIEREIHFNIFFVINVKI